jgi:polysaccharide export outer membrane protein
VSPAGVEPPRVIFGEYRIQPGDRLYMSVWGEPSLTSDTVVMTHGRVPFPLLGETMAAGKTVSELTEEVRQGYLRYYRDPRVSLFVVPVVWPSVYVQGNVREPGPVEYLPGRRLLDYIGMAGGFGADADFSQIGIVSHENGRALKTTVDLSAISSDGESTPNPVLKPGNTVWVGRALPVSVLGAVNSPGAVDYRHGLRLSDYVGMAGGPTNRAELGKALLKRVTPDGSSSVARVDLRAALGQPDDPQVNPVLTPGDTVIVPERFIAGTIEWRDILRAVVGIYLWN